MTLEEIDEEFRQFCIASSDCGEADFARKYMPKLLAIAWQAEWIINFHEQMPTQRIPESYFVVLKKVLDLSDEK